MRILMISNHLGVQSGVQRYVQNLLLNLDTTKYKVDLFVGLCPADQASTAPALIAHGVNIIGVPDHKKDRIRALYRHLKNQYYQHLTRFHLWLPMNVYIDYYQKKQLLNFHKHSLP